MGIEELCPSCGRLQVRLDCVEPALSVNKIGMRLLASLHLHLTPPVCIQWEHFGHALALTKPSFGWILPLGRPPLNQFKEVRLNSPGVSQKFTSNSYFRRRAAGTCMSALLIVLLVYRLTNGTGRFLFFCFCLLGTVDCLFSRLYKSTSMRIIMTTLFIYETRLGYSVEEITKDSVFSKIQIQGSLRKSR